MRNCLRNLCLDWNNDKEEPLSAKPDIWGPHFHGGMLKLSGQESELNEICDKVISTVFRYHSIEAYVI